MPLNQLIKDDHLILNSQPGVIRFEEGWVLLFQLLPNKRCETRINFGLFLEDAYHFTLIHVKLEAPFYEVLHELDVQGA